MLQDKQAGEEKEEGGHNRQINTGGTREKGPPVFNGIKPCGASRDSLAAGEGAGTGAIAFHPSRYHVYGT